MSTNDINTENNNTSNSGDDPFAHVVDNFFNFLDASEKDPKTDRELLTQFREVMLREMRERPTLFAKIWSGNPELYKQAREEYATTLNELESKYREGMKRIFEYYGNDERIMASFVEMEKRLAEKQNKKEEGLAKGL